MMGAFLMPNFEASTFLFAVGKKRHDFFFSLLSRELAAADIHYGRPQAMPHQPLAPRMISSYIIFKLLIDATSPSPL